MLEFCCSVCVHIVLSLNIRGRLKKTYSHFLREKKVNRHTITKAIKPSTIK